MDKRNSFVIYIDSLDVLDQLDDNQAGKLFKAIKAYQKEEEIDLDPMTKILFPFFKNYFDRNKEKYVAESEHRSESGFMGNLKRWHHDLFVKVTANQMTREQAQAEVNLRKLSLPDSTQSTPIANVATVADSESVIESEPVIEINNISPLFKLDTEKFLEDQKTPEGISEETPKRLPHLKQKIEDTEFYKEGLKYVDWFIKEHLPVEIKEPEKLKKSWTETYEKLRRIDKKTKDEIKIATEWARSDSFWVSNFLSPNKLREKNKQGAMYIDVFLAKASESKKKSHNPATDATQGLGYDDTKGGNGKVWNAAIGKFRYPADWKGPKV